MAKYSELQKKRLSKAYKALKYELKAIITDKEDREIYQNHLKDLKKTIDKIVNETTGADPIKK